MRLDDLVDQPDTADDPYRKRFFVLMGVIALVVILVVGAIVWLFPRAGEGERVTTTPLSEEDRRSAETVLQEFIQESATFGFAPEGMSPELLFSSRQLLLNQDPTASASYKSRANVYRYLRDTYVLPESALYVQDRAVDSWNTRFELVTLNSYRPSSVTVEAPRQGYRITLGETEYLAMDIPLTFTSTFTQQVYSTSETGAPIFTPKEEKIEVTGVATLVQSGTTWKLTALDISHPALTSAWLTPNESDYNEFVIPSTEVNGEDNG